MLNKIKQVKLDLEPTCLSPKPTSGATLAAVNIMFFFSPGLFHVDSFPVDLSMLPVSAFSFTWL